MEYLKEEISAFLEQGSELGMCESQITSAHTEGGKYIKYGDQMIIDLSRLDYLALGSEDRIRRLMLKSIETHDVSCPASQFVLKPGALKSLEISLARWHGLQDSLLFSNGYSTNINVMQALGLRLRSPHLAAYAKSYGIGKDTRHIPTVFLIDSDSHYSLVHGVRVACKLSNQCHSYSYQTGNMAQLRNALQKVDARFGKEAIKIIVSDTLVSSTGRYIDVAALYEIAEQHDCLLYLDEAHTVGAVGPEGAGVARAQLPEGFEQHRVIIMGTLTKAFSQLGGYVSFGDPGLMSLVRVCCPQYIFSAPLLPWMAHTLEQTLQLVAGDWGEHKRRALINKSNYLRKRLAINGFDTLGSESHIIPVLIGDEVECLQVRLALLEEGFNVACFQFPAVPRGQAILRISMSSDITLDEIDALVGSIIKHAKQPARVCYG